jgi:serine O-acetyltransferase
MNLRVPNPVNVAIRARTWPMSGALAHALLRLGGAEISPSVRIGPGFRLVHGGSGVVIHPTTTIGAGVTIFQGVTVGRAGVHEASDPMAVEGVVIEDGVTLGAGAKVLFKSGVLRVGRGTIVGANAVLLQSTGEQEIWVGVPARRISPRSGAGASRSET